MQVITATFIKEANCAKCKRYLKNMLQNYFSIVMLSLTTDLN